LLAVADAVLALRVEAPEVVVEVGLRLLAAIVCSANVVADRMKRGASVAPRQGGPPPAGGAQAGAAPAEAR
jgi:hypothetical protein